MYLLSLVEEVFVGVVGIAPVYGGGLDVSVERMPSPEHHRLQIAPCFFRPGNEGISEFMGMMLGEQPLECGAQRIDVDVLSLLEVHEVLHLSEHRGERYVPQGDVPAHAFLARFAFEGIAVNDL